MELGDFHQLDQVNPIQDSGSLSREIERNDDGDTANRLHLPAQGALFITNYRVIFIGVPKDPYREYSCLISPILFMIYFCNNHVLMALISCRIK